MYYHKTFQFDYKLRGEGEKDSPPHLIKLYNKRLRPKTQFQDFIFKTNWLSTVTINKSKQCLLLNRAEFTTSKLIFLFGILNNISLNLLILCFEHV